MNGNRQIVSTDSYSYRRSFFLHICYESSCIKHYDDIQRKHSSILIYFDIVYVVMIL